MQAVHSNSAALSHDQIEGDKTELEFPGSQASSSRYLFVVGFAMSLLLLIGFSYLLEKKSRGSVRVRGLVTGARAEPARVSDLSAKVALNHPTRQLKRVNPLMASRPSEDAQTKEGDQVA